ncbi:class I SAM-dependent methyltransferase [Candidatus Saganbacteria bacterium]|nr:class I SAM-dependent methyltransferase [Candidatus Saganbacteria bacterium]
MKAVADWKNLVTLYKKARYSIFYAEWWNKSSSSILLNLEEIIENYPDRPAILPKGSVATNSPSTLEQYFFHHLPFLPPRPQAIPGNGFSVTDSITNSLRDEIRTKKFMLGIKEAVGQLRLSNSGLIHVIDAGCGTIPILGIYAALLSPKVRVVCLELNPQSVAVAQALVKTLGLEDQITVIHQDATTCRISGAPIDLLISETMNSGLFEEPLVPIMTNLHQYVRPGGLVLPSRVDILGTLFPYEDVLASSLIVNIQGTPVTYVEPNWQRVLTYHPGDLLTRIHFALPSRHLRRGKYVDLISSTVSIGSQTIRGYDSSISAPAIALNHTSNDWWILDVTEQPPPSIIINYAPGDSLNGAASVK